MTWVRRLRLIVLTTAIVAVFTITTGGTSWGAGEEAAERLRRRLEAPTESQALVVADDPLYCTESLRRFYRGRDFTLAWSHDGAPSDEADSLLAMVRNSEQEGLNPQDYHFDLIRTLRNRIAEVGSQQEEDVSDAALVDLDLLLTDSFLLMGTHFLAGHLDPESIDPEWVANRRGGDMPTTLAAALGEKRVAASLRGLLPPQAGYARLRALLSDLRALREKGGWPPIPAGERLQPGDSGPRVKALAARLDHSAANDTYDETLVAKVKEFQRQHGLDVDGVVGPATLAALNVPVADRISQTLVNLERWRWLPQDLGRRHILVNIADQRLRTFIDGQPALESPVIVGRAQRRTPVFSGRITYLVFRPYWEVPPSLAVQDKLPDLRKDPQRLVDLGFQVFRGWGESEREIDPLTVDWTQVAAASFPYRLRQKPGPQNALGNVKFMFPNKYNVYLHDTPSRDLFSRSNRTFSSGCIRVQNPTELADLLLSDQPQWTTEAISTAMTTGQDRTVRLKEAWLVHLEYWTAWVEPDGTAHFRSDIYGRDARVIAALREAPPEAP